MLRSRSTTRRRRLSLELVLTGVFALVALGWYINANPIILSLAQSEEADAPLPQGLQGSDVAVILSDGKEARSWERLHCDQAWLNTIEQEVGHYQLLNVSSFDINKIQGAAWTVIPRDTARVLSTDQISDVRKWVNAGGVLILEQPEGPWGELIGARLDTGHQRSSRRVTSFDAALSRGLARERIRTMPLHTTIMPYQPRRMTRGRDYHILMEVDGTPGVVGIPVEDGYIILILFDFGRAAVAMQQGLPSGDFSLTSPSNVKTPKGLTVSSVQAINTDPREAMVPWIDLLERNLLYLADHHRPVGRLWLFPGRYRGALLASHSESGVGDVMRYMPEWEHAHDASSTSFIIANSVRPEVLSSIRRRKSDIQLQWVPSNAPIAPMKSWGIRNIRPVLRAMTLDEQREELDGRLLPYPPTIATRTLDGIWPTNYFEAYRQLEAIGVQLDSSLGPTPAFLAPESKDGGYIFGTGLPFRPIDADGRRFSFHELPYQLSDGNTGYSGQRVRQLIVESSDAYHTAINIDWRADTMSRHPSFDALEGWRNAFELATSQGLWVTEFNQYAEFLRYREKAAVRSAFSDQRLIIQAHIPEVRRDDDGRFVPLVPSVSFPARYRSRPVEFVWVDGDPVNVYDMFLSGDRAMHVVPLTPGEHRIEVYYGSLADPTPD